MTINQPVSQVKMDKSSEVKFRGDKLSLDPPTPSLPHPNTPPISTSILLTSGSLMTPEELWAESTNPPNFQSHYVIPVLRLS